MFLHFLKCCFGPKFITFHLKLLHCLCLASSVSQDGATKTCDLRQRETKEVKYTVLQQYKSSRYLKEMIQP